MDEKLKNQVLISVVPAGIVFMLYQFIFNMEGQIMGFFYAFLLAVLIGGATFGVVYFMQKE